MSGAFKSKSLFRRLFLLITLLYKSFKSEVANLPPSKGTSGLNSGGITGTDVRIIHSGLFPDEIKDSISFNGDRITNIEMETSAIYTLSKLLGHEALSMNAIITNRADGTYSEDSKKAVENTIVYVLDKLAD